MEAATAEEAMPEAPNEEKEQRSHLPAYHACRDPHSHNARAANSTVLASPAVRRRARNPDRPLVVSGSGRGGRIQQSDLDAVLATGAPALRAQIRQEGWYKGNESRRPQKEDSRTDGHIDVIHTSFLVLQEVDVTALEELRQLLNSGRVEGQPKPHIFHS